MYAVEFKKRRKIQITKEYKENRISDKTDWNKSLRIKMHFARTFNEILY